MLQPQGHHVNVHFHRGVSGLYGYVRSVTVAGGVSEDIIFFVINNALNVD